jgi:uncharacterized RDD family membrane protein YckC
MTPTIRYTNRFERVVSTFCDTLLIGVAWILFDPLFETWTMSVRIPFATLFSIVYFVLLEGPLGSGQTFGKKMFGLRVLSTDGAVLSYGQSFKRYFFVHLLPQLLITIAAWFVSDNRVGYAPILGFIGQSYYFLDLIIFFRDPQRRALHDYLAQTVVLKTGSTIPDGWPADLEAPLSRIQWKRYWLGLSLVTIYLTLSIIMVHKSHDMPVDNSPATVYRRCLADEGLSVASFKDEGATLHFEVMRSNWNLLSRRRESNPTFQERIVIKATKRLITKKIIDPTKHQRVIYYLRRVLSPKAIAVWSVDTTTLAATPLQTADLVAQPTSPSRSAPTRFPL